jgi:prevent-host-death family protein
LKSGSYAACNSASTAATGEFHPARHAHAKKRVGYIIHEIDDCHGILIRKCIRPLRYALATQALALSIKDLLLMRLTGANIRPVNGSFGVTMSTKFSEDVVPLTDLKANPGRVMKHVSDAHRPVLLTSRGRGVAVVQSVADYEQTEEERAFMRAVVEGLMDLEAGREVSLAKARKRLGLK